MKIPNLKLRRKHSKNNVSKLPKMLWRAITVDKNNILVHFIIGIFKLQYNVWITKTFTYYSKCRQDLISINGLLARKILKCYFKSITNILNNKLLFTITDSMRKNQGKCMQHWKQTISKCMRHNKKCNLKAWESSKVLLICT